MPSTCPSAWCKFFRAIHDHHRQHILELIKAHQEVNASQIVKQLKLAQPTVSHHLKILEQAQLIKVQKRGKEMIYQINKSSIIKCCGGFIDKFAN